MRLRIVMVAAFWWLLSTQFALAAKPTAVKREAGEGDLPEAVQKTVAKHFPDAKVLGFEHEADSKRQLYFVDLKTERGDVTMLASGRGQYLGVVEDDDSGDVCLDLASAPAAVKSAIEKRFGNDSIDKLFMEVEEARFVFCAEQTKAGVTKWVSFSLQGALEEEETEIGLKDLPEAVAAGIKSSRPGAKLLSASLVEVKKPAAEMRYSVDVSDGKDKLTLSVAPEGKVLSAEPTEEDASTTKP